MKQWYALLVGLVISNSTMAANSIIPNIAEEKVTLHAIRQLEERQNEALSCRIPRDSFVYVSLVNALVIVNNSNNTKANHIKMQHITEYVKSIQADSQFHKKVLLPTIEQAQQTNQWDNFYINIVNSQYTKDIFEIFLFTGTNSTDKSLLKYHEQYPKNNDQETQTMFTEHLLVYTLFTSWIKTIENKLSKVSKK